MGGMGFKKVQERVDRIEKLTEYHQNKDRYRRAREIALRVREIDEERQRLLEEAYRLVPELFQGGGPTGPIYPSGDLVSDVSDYCPDYEPDDDFDESTGRGMLPIEIERRFDDFSRWSARSLDRDVPGYDPPGVNEYDEYGYQSDVTYPPH